MNTRMSIASTRRFVNFITSFFLLYSFPTLSIYFPMHIDFAAYDTTPLKTRLGELRRYL